MFTTVEDPGSKTPEELLGQYESALRSVIEDLGVETVADRTDVNREQIDAIAAGESVEIELLDAANVLAVGDGDATPEHLEATARDELLIGMTTAVLDVDTLASELNGRLDARTIQQKIEGRFPMTLEEFALIQQKIDERAP